MFFLEAEALSYTFYWVGIFVGYMGMFLSIYFYVGGTSLGDIKSQCKSNTKYDKSEW